MPNRIIKESICTSDSVDQLSWFEEVLFYRLIVNCDDFGRYDGRPAIIKNRIFPLKNKLTEKAVKDAIENLVKADLVIYYVVDGKPFLQLRTWDDHQRIRAKRSKYPEPSESDLLTNDSKLLTNDSKSLSNASVIQSNPIQYESESNAREVTHSHGMYGWVKLTDAEYEKLQKDLGITELNRCIQYIDESAQQNGNKNKWKDWNLVIRKCHRDGWGLNNKKLSVVDKMRIGNNHEFSQSNLDALERLKKLNETDGI